MLTSDLDSEEEKDRAALDSLLIVLLDQLGLNDKTDSVGMATRSATRETQLVVMRLLSVLMSRTKAGTKPTAEVNITRHAIKKD